MVLCNISVRFTFTQILLGTGEGLHVIVRVDMNDLNKMFY